MILSIYALLLFIVAMLLVIGYTTKQIYMLFLAYAFLFVLSVTMMTTGITYSTGANISDVGSITVITNTYSVYSDARMGLYLAVISVAAFAVTMFQYRRLMGDE
jgi:hypothetical protein